MQSNGFDKAAIDHGERVMLGYQRRTAVLAMAVAVALAGLVGCSDDGKPTKVLGEVIERSGASDASAAPASTSTTAAPTTTTAPTPTTAAPAPTTAQPITPAPTTPAPEPDPGPTEAPAPPPIIEWRYQVPEGSTATATIDGPSGHIVKQIVNGGAVFDGLLEGTYEMVLEVDTPTPPTDTTGATLGPASTTSRGRAEVHAGDHVFIDCTGYGDCNGVA
jgi:hypothetical protein